MSLNQSTTAEFNIDEWIQFPSDCPDTSASTATTSEPSRSCNDNIAVCNLAEEDTSLAPLSCKATGDQRMPLPQPELVIIAASHETSLAPPKSPLMQKSLRTASPRKLVPRKRDLTSSPKPLHEGKCHTRFLLLDPLPQGRLSNGVPSSYCSTFRTRKRAPSKRNTSVCIRCREKKKKCQVGFPCQNCLEAIRGRSGFSLDADLILADCFDSSILTLSLFTDGIYSVL